MTAGGERVGSYEIIEEVGHGALATVFLARQLRSHRDVALKRVRLDPPDTTLARRLVDEVDVVMALTHPNISSVIDCFEYDGMPYVVMEHIPGGSLRHVHRSLAPAQVVGVLEQILAALAHAEIEHVVHCDLKPENVLVARDGVVKVADFAIARACRTALHRGAGRAPVGTPAYMAPEQALGRPEGPPTDLYAVGVMAYEMLAGRLPFGAAASSPAVLARHVHDPVPSLGPRADPPLDEWVGRMLAKDPASRPQRASAAWSALEEVAVRAAGPHWRFSAALPERPVAAPARVRPATTRRRRLASAALAVAALAGVGTLVAFGRDSAPPPAPRTEIVRRAPTHGIARALRPVIAANRHLTRQLNALTGAPPAAAALAAVGKGQAATRWTSRTSVAPAFASLLRAEDRYLARLRVALRNPRRGRLAAVSRAATRLRIEFLRLGDALAPGGATSVAGLTRLRRWARAQQRRRATTIEPRRTDVEAVTTATPAPSVHATATPTSIPAPPPTPTSQPSEPAPTTEPSMPPTPVPVATP